MGAADPDLPKLHDWTSTIDRIFEIGCPDAPGLHFLGALTRASDHFRHASDAAISVGGVGLTAEAAFRACIGEAVERLAQRAPEPGAAAADARLAAAHVPLFAPLMPDAELGPNAWTNAINLTTGEPALAPKPLCWTPSVEDGICDAERGLGCAAAPTLDRASLHGILEWVERDCAAHWWLAGRPGRPLAIETLAAAGLDSLVRQVGRNRSPRRSWCLDLTGDAGIPCVASLSVLPGAGGFAHGVAARPTMASAVRAAFLEMCQMEVAMHLIALKRRADPHARLSPADRRHLERFAGVDPDRHDLLHPQGAPAVGDDLPEDDLRGVVDRLAATGHECLVVDLSRPELPMPAVKTIVTGLQPMPSRVETERLARARADGARRPTIDVPLF